MDQVNYLAPRLLKLRLWPDLKDPTKQWASSLVDNGFAPWNGSVCRCWSYSVETTRRCQILSDAFSCLFDGVKLEIMNIYESNITMDWCTRVLLPVLFTLLLVILADDSTRGWQQCRCSCNNPQTPFEMNIYNDSLLSSDSKLLGSSQNGSSLNEPSKTLKT